MNPKFDLLAEIGTQAIIDGYFRDSVASFSSSLERFYEFYFRVICRKNGIEQSETDRVWKRVARQSERQLGLFIAAFLAENRIAPNLLIEKTIAFRNGVVHQGDIPTEHQSIEFGQEVIDLAYPLARDLFTRYQEQVMEQQKLEGQWDWSFAEPGDVNMSAGGGMIFNMSMTAPPHFDLTEDIARRRAARTP